MSADEYETSTGPLSLTRIDWEVSAIFGKQLQKKASETDKARLRELQAIRERSLVTLPSIHSLKKKLRQI